jgi:hypothetical protein
MSAPSYTTCVSPNSYKDPNLPKGNFLTSLGMVIAQGGFDLLLRICDYILHGKLVCLGGDRCAIGRVASFETVDDKSGFDKLDNDFSINLALCPNPLSGLQAGSAHRVSNYESAVANKQGELIEERPGTPKPREGSDDQKPSPRYAGTFVKIHNMLTLDNPIPEEIANESDATTWHLPVFHTEIEGNRAAYVCATANAIWGPIHNTVCKIPLIGGFICTVLTILLAPFIAAALALLSAAWVAGSNDNRDFDGGGDLKADDLVLIFGRWVYDAGHGGWNELHPVKHIQKIPDESACKWENFDALHERWCKEIGKVPQGLGGLAGPPADSTQQQQETWDSQTRPENRWFFHPLVDGCEPDDETYTPPPIK